MLTRGGKKQKGSCGSKRCGRVPASLFSLRSMSMRSGLHDSGRVPTSLLQQTFIPSRPSMDVSGNGKVPVHEHWGVKGLKIKLQKPPLALHFFLPVLPLVAQEWGMIKLISLYINICCEVRFWPIFCHLDCYVLAQVDG